MFRNIFLCVLVSKGRKVFLLKQIYELNRQSKHKALVLSFCLLANVTPEIETTFITSCQCNAKKVKGYSDKILIKSLDHGVMYFKYDGQSFPQAFLFLVLSNHCIYKLSLGLDFQSKDMYNINCNE